ncbi:hypothetical protein CspeluHIS016_0210880 [Cutaneotrichosporon spelunceum]|uniref:Transcription initiation factor TFIID subunit 10 n=1 Tax=Cutaneotrichosporon spelunceum TaxID=1672016 RepID=A0AAD3YBL2_9TREE|nr:hypothetical protein CspeluHIS016_0210880 [Cutaneotrichosporon spelunceum]
MSTANGTPSTSPPQPDASSSNPNPNPNPTPTPTQPPPSQLQPNLTQEKKETSEEDEDKEGHTDIFAARREEENARRDRSLAEFLVMLDGYKPLIPEEVTEYYLQRAGFECQDPRLKRLLSLSAQKFISDLSRDAFHFAKLRVSNTAAGRGRPSAGADRNRVVLTMDDLSLALGEHGVNVKKPDYYI